MYIHAGIFFQAAPGSLCNPEKKLCDGARDADEHRAFSRAREAEGFPATRAGALCIFSGRKSVAMKTRMGRHLWGESAGSWWKSCLRSRDTVWFLVPLQGGMY